MMNAKSEENTRHREMDIQTVVLSMKMLG
uniref:Uncharacterized protein n=1 Tax=Tetranychus urticae TaxID=32264 RepID=T1KNC1_TETUR